MSENLTDFGFVTDADALAAILAKKSTGTPLNSRAISMLWDDSAKSKAFFSARVTSADILEGLREQVNRVVSGQVSKEQAVWWMKRFLESKGDSALMDMGFATVEAAKAGDSLAELGSHRRLSLIVDQNVSMARSAREWQQMKEDADIVPFVRYRTREDGSVRNSHALLDRLVFRKDDPALRQIYPPQDFRCRCRMEELDDDDAAGLPIQKGLPDGWEPAKSGYTFDPEQWAAQGLEAKEKWGDDLTKNFEADSMAHGQGRIDALQKNRDIMADLAKTSTDKWQKADAEKAVVSFDERIAQVKAGMQAKANQEAKAKAEAERNAAQIAKLQAEQAESRRIEEEKAKAVKNSTKEDRIIIGKGELNKSSDKAIAKKLNISDDAMKKLLEFRDKKRRQSFESVLIIDEDGKTILEKDGEQYNVSFSQDEVNKIEKYRSDTGKKIILTHNHPRGLEREDSDIRSWGNSFSEDDIRLAKTLNLSTIIATTPKQTFYMSSDEWPSDITIKKISNSIRKRFMDAISKAYNEETVQWADALHHHSIYTTLLSMKKMKKTTYWAEADI